jgi:ATP-dependent DNA helicase RecQ
LEAIEAVVEQRSRLLVVQRTGWGKSAVYFVATRLLRDRGAGTTIIVSPLLALMRDQIEAASRLHLNAVTINSSNTEEWDRIEKDLLRGAVDLLLVSPERFNNADFRDRLLGPLSRSAGLLVVDEAHCISDWGHDFRPDYRRIVRVLEFMPPGLPVLCTTATAKACRCGRLGSPPLWSGWLGLLSGSRAWLGRASSTVSLSQTPRGWRSG